MKFALVEDSDLIRAGLSRLFPEIIPWLQFTGSYSDGQNALDNLDFSSIELLITDMEMEPISGEDLIRKIRPKFPELKIISITVHPTPNYMHISKDAGANGHVVKGADIGKIYQTFEEVRDMQTLSFVCHTVDGVLDVVFTEKEELIMRLLAEGYNSKDIASVVNLSPRSVEGYRKRLCEKLDVANTPALIAKAVKLKLID